MKRDKVATLYYIASVGFYIAAIVGYCTGSNKAMAPMWACLGSAMLCFGAARTNQIKKEQDKQKKQNQDNAEEQNQESSNEEV